MIEHPPSVVTAHDWERCRGWLEAALEYAQGTHLLGDVLAEIEANKATFWAFEKSVCVTQMIDWPRLKQLHFWLVGGDLEDLLSHEPGVIEWGRSHGCTRFSTAGRMGWRKAMKPLGYEFLCESVAKDIEP